MQCTNCGASALLNELIDGRCHKCTSKELATVKLLLAHAAMAIEDGERVYEGVGGRPSYRPVISEAFLGRMKSIVTNVNTESSLAVAAPMPTYQPEVGIKLPRCKHCGVEIFRPWRGRDQKGLTGWRHTSVDRNHFTYHCAGTLEKAAEPVEPYPGPDGVTGDAPAVSVL